MNTIALDGDGVLLDYNAAYPLAWERAFGENPSLRDPDAYSPLDRWNVRKVEGTELDKLRAAFDETFWSSIPAIPGALEACEMLSRAGFHLVCVTALADRHGAARLQNLRSLGFPIERVITTPGESHARSPKAQALSELMPLAFVDDFAPYLRGVDSSIHRALILRDPVGSPNEGELLALSHSTHKDLLGFATWLGSGDVLKSANPLPERRGEP